MHINTTHKSNTNSLPAAVHSVVQETKTTSWWWTKQTCKQNNFVFKTLMTTLFNFTKQVSQPVPQAHPVCTGQRVQHAYIKSGSWWEMGWPRLCNLLPHYVCSIFLVALLPVNDAMYFVLINSNILFKSPLNVCIFSFLCVLLLMTIYNTNWVWTDAHPVKKGSLVNLKYRNTKTFSVITEIDNFAAIKAHLGKKFGKLTAPCSRQKGSRPLGAIHTAKSVHLTPNKKKL